MTYKRKWFLGLEEFRLLIDRSVAVNAAMKSGLKERLIVHECRKKSVITLRALMKRDCESLNLHAWTVGASE